MTFIFIHLLCGVLVWKFLVWETTTIEGSDVTLKDYLWAPVVILFGIFRKTLKTVSPVAKGICP